MQPVSSTPLLFLLRWFTLLQKRCILSNPAKRAHVRRGRVLEREGPRDPPRSVLFVSEWSPIGATAFPSEAHLLRLRGKTVTQPKVLKEMSVS